LVFLPLTFAALILGLAKYKELTAGLRLAGLPPWSGIALIAAFPLCALIFSIIPSMREQRRIRRRSEIRVDIGKTLNASRSEATGRAQWLGTGRAMDRPP
jgi:hypothetical protein